MLIGIEGDLGSGKTVYAVRCALKDFLDNRKLISNTPLFNIEYDEFDIDAFLSNNDEYRKKLENATILLDEITVYMDCRLGSSKQNLLMGYLVLQSRKRGIDIYYTTQSLDLVDYKRLVKYTRILVFAQEIYIKENGKTKTIDDWRRYTVFNTAKHRNNIMQFDLNIEPFYKYYDTDYIIEPLIKYKNKDVKKTN